ncbi:hypothetical protein Mgra_00002901 [Meloidogyne graminicola]|uniref:Uncharacterized protein n=1 Tax=Meloidogyne graminicola TaxID=189291 RepID=A0A8S9ZWX3_9BILA|nr:hypothetical protein Mgra_00002901 [Meloidogyne graminicola]
MSTMFENDFAQHRFLAWHISTLVLLSISITSGIFALFASCCVLWTVICSTIGCIIFFVNANRPEIRYVQIPTSAERWRINEQIRGFSFDLSFASIFIFLISFIIGILSTITVFINSNYDQQRRHLIRKTFPKTEIATVSSPVIDTSTSTAIANFGTENSRAHSPGIPV